MGFQIPWEDKEWVLRVTWALREGNAPRLQ